MKNRPQSIAFELRISYRSGVDEAEKVLKTATDVIGSFRQFDDAAVRGLGLKGSTKIVLESTTEGSLRLKLLSLVESVDEDDLRNLSWKRIIGKALVAFHKRLVGLMSKGKTIRNNDIDELESELNNEITKLAARENVLWVPIPAHRLAQLASALNESVRQLPDGGRLFYSDGQTETELVSSQVSPDLDLQLLEGARVLEHEQQIFLQPKKPDLLGDSKWQFVYDGRIIEAHVQDKEWKEQVRQGKIQIKVGMVISATVHVSIAYSIDGSILGHRYDIHKVNYVTYRDENQEKLDL